MKRNRPTRSFRAASPARLESLERRTFLSANPFGEIAPTSLLGDLLGGILGNPAPLKDNPTQPGDDSGKGKDDDALPAGQILTTDLTVRGTADHTVTVVYTDPKKIRAKSIDMNDVVVTSPAGPNVTITGVSITPDKDSDQVTATYTLAAPGGRWDTADNGAYTVTVKPLEVFGSRFIAVESTSATFNVNIQTADNVAPVGVIQVGNITSAGATSHKVTVTYTDDVGINPLSIGPADLSITGPGGVARPVRTVNVNGSDDGTQIIATYTFDAPGKSWDASDNGVYQVSLNPNGVRDASEKGATASPASFTVAIAAPQPIDSGFGSGTGSGASSGSISASFVAEAVIAQADGKLVVAGRQGSLSSGTSQGVIQRFNADGTLDTAFGSKGKVVTAAGGKDAYYAIALGANGQILVAGQRGGNALVSRYDASGKLDPTFGKSGSSVTDFGTDADAAYAVGVASDGSVVIAAGPGGNFAVARLTSSGAPDPGFGQGGVLMLDLGGADDTPSAVAFQPDGKLIVVGASGGKVAVVRLRTNGEADTSFSGDGLLLIDSLASRAGVSVADRSTGAAVQPDGKLLLANRSSTGDFAIARLNANGQLDSSFGNAGVSTVDFGGDDDADAVLVQDTGEILVIGTTSAGGSADTAVAALDSSGSLITAFGAGGKLTLTTGAAASERELHLGDLVLRAFGTRQPDGRVVVGSASGSEESTTSSSSLRRLNVPGTRTQPLGTQLGTFGVADGKRTTLNAIDADGTTVTFSASRGSGTVYLSGSRYNVVLNDPTGGASVNLKTAGGDGRVTLGDVIVSGTLRSLIGRTADLAGTLFASGGITKISLGALTGSIAAAGTIGSVSLASMTGARIMAGTSLGADGKLGGTDADADTFSAGSIGVVRVAGAIEASTISAGLDPVDGVFNNDDDRVVGGSASTIRSIAAAGADETSQFISGKIGSLRLPKTIDLAADGRVVLMPTV